MGKTYDIGASTSLDDITEAIRLGYVDDDLDDIELTLRERRAAIAQVVAKPGRTATFIDQIRPMYLRGLEFTLGDKEGDKVRVYFTEASLRQCPRAHRYNGGKVRLSHIRVK